MPFEYTQSLTTVVKLIGKSVAKKEEIQASIKARSKIGHSLKQIFTEISVLLKEFPKYDEKKFAKVVTGDKTWIHYFEAVRKVNNKIWATRNNKRKVIAKCTFSAKKVLYAVYFSGEGIPVQVPVKKCKSITGKYYEDVVLKKLKRYTTTSL